MEMSRTKQEPEKSYLIVHNNNGSEFTDEYKALTKEFYLHF
jgi:tRNA1(Val) A37 N6-methylase TrmN6